MQARPIDRPAHPQGLCDAVGPDDGGLGGYLLKSLPRPTGRRDGQSQVQQQSLIVRGTIGPKLIRNADQCPFSRPAILQEGHGKIRLSDAALSHPGSQILEKLIYIKGCQIGHGRFQSIRRQATHQHDHQLLLNQSAIGQIEFNVDAGLFFEADRQLLIPFIGSYVILAHMNDGHRGRRGISCGKHQQGHRNRGQKA